ncbi:MAG: L-threonylcarbamoyladenylate synthase [Pseudomonadota bacterium]
MATPSPTILPPNESGIARAAKALRDGGVVAFGTETVYGLGADAGNPQAVSAVFALKQRPAKNPLICHVDGLDMAKTIARVDDHAEGLIRHFWPGPLTLILPYSGGDAVTHTARAGLGTVAIRAPAHPVARALITAVGRPVVAPSANKSGRLSPTSAMMVAEALGQDVPLILGGGRCDIGLESTVLDLTNQPPTILRPGAIMAEDLAAFCPDVQGFQDQSEPNAPASPGLLLRHYAPRLPLRIEVREGPLAADEAFIGFGPNPFPPKGGHSRHSLSPTGDLDEAAQALFGLLKTVEDSGAARIAVAPIPDTGIGLAINDRLRRAAAASQLDSGGQDT